MSNEKLGTKAIWLFGLATLVVAILVTYLIPKIVGPLSPKAIAAVYGALFGAGAAAATFLTRANVFAVIGSSAVVPCPLRERLGWRWDLDELESRITAKTRAIYVNSPHNPTGGVLTREDVERIAAIAARRGIWILSDEAYEDVLFVEEHDPHVNPLGVKGVGEVAIVGIAPAIANAIYHATGMRIRELPVTPDKLI
jgi:hypothetical protein